MLSEIYSLRALNGSNDEYYGVAHTAYTRGVAGIGCIGAPTALGWNWGLTSMSEVMAHELGHNWGRQHAPCGGVAGPDPSSPYASGITGAFGWNVRTNTLMQSTIYDLMGYCSPTWISDYNYSAVFNYRKSNCAGTITAGDVQPGLLIWGSVAGDGTITLEPAVRVNGRSVLPVQPGSFTASATDANRAQIFSISFEPTDMLDDAPGDEQHFAFVVPISDADHVRLRTLSVTGSGRRAERSAKLSSGALDAIANSAALGATAGNVHVSGTAATCRSCSCATRRPVTCSRWHAKGEINLLSDATDVDLVFTDGVHSTPKRKPLRGRQCPAVFSRRQARTRRHDRYNQSDVYVVQWFTSMKV